MELFSCLVSTKILVEGPKSPPLSVYDVDITNVSLQRIITLMRFYEVQSVKQSVLSANKALPF
jgi:hypothetical protein